MLVVVVKTAGCIEALQLAELQTGERRVATPGINQSRSLRSHQQSQLLRLQLTSVRQAAHTSLLSYNEKIIFMDSFVPRLSFSEDYSNLLNKKNPGLNKYP